MGMSDYYKDLREKIGDQLIFMPSVAGIIRNDQDFVLFGRKHHECMGTCGRCHRAGRIPGRGDGSRSEGRNWARCRT